MQRRFELYDVILQLIAELRPLVEKLRQRDRDQALQLKKAANSILSNVAEGSRRQGRDRLQHWNIAAGSAGEVRVQIEAAMAWGDLELDSSKAALELLDRSLAMLWRMTHSPRPLPQPHPLPHP
jgi:four helix bundle protein